MSDCFKSYQRAGLTIELWSDEACDFESPLAWDGCIANFVAWHRRHNLGDQEEKHGVKVVHRSWGGLHVEIDGREYEANSWSEMNQIIRRHADVAVCYPVWMIDHSMLAFRLGESFAAEDPGEWDSGIVGFLFARPEAVREQYGVKRITQQIVERVKADLQYDIKAYGNWINGWMTGYTIKDAVGNELDSIGGYYTSEEAEKEA